MFIILLALINLGLAALISYLSFNSNNTLFIVFIFIFFLGLILIEALIFFLIPFFAGINKPSSVENKTYKRGYRKLFTFYVRIVNALFGVKIITSGLDKIPDGPVIFIANHRSNMDPFIMEQVLYKKDMIFVAKKSLFNIPFFGRIINQVGFQRINSNFLIEKSPAEVLNDKRHDLIAIKNCIDLINEQGVSVSIYPEAMRNFQDKVLLEFKHGVFHIAKKTNVPIVVMSLKGTEDFKKNVLFKRHKVELKVLDVLYSDEYANLANDEIAAKLYDMIYEDIKDYYTEYEKNKRENK